MNEWKRASKEENSFKEVKKAMTNTPVLNALTLKRIIK